MSPFCPIRNSTVLNKIVKEDLTPENSVLREVKSPSILRENMNIMDCPSNRTEIPSKNDNVNFNQIKPAIST